MAIKQANQNLAENADFRGKERRGRGATDPHKMAPFAHIKTKRLWRLAGEGNACSFHSAAKQRKKKAGRWVGEEVAASAGDAGVSHKSWVNIEFGGRGM